jgi:hypothetical protein
MAKKALIMFKPLFLQKLLKVQTSYKCHSDQHLKLFYDNIDMLSLHFVYGSGTDWPDQSLELSLYDFCLRRHHTLSPVVNTPASYSGGPRFKSWPRDRLSWLRFLVVSPSPPGQMPRKYLNIRPWPLPSKSFPIHHSLTAYHLMLYCRSCWKCIIK